MSLANYSVPFAPPAATTYLGAPDFGGLSPAAAINSLLYDTPRQTPRQPPPPPSSPNRRQTTKKTKDLRDPYRNQYPPQQRQVNGYAHPNDQFTNQYDDNYQEQNEESQLRRHYLEEVNNNKATSNPSKTITKRKQQTPQQIPPPPPQPQEQDDGSWPNRPPGYTRIANTFNSAPEPGAKTSIHAVLDFDDDFGDYNYEDDDIEPLPPSLQKSPKPQVTPIEGPIFIKNGSVPVVPLYSYPTVNNGSLVQIPILWTALSLALGLEIRGEIIRGVPCIKRFHQLFCPTAGNSYPIDRIEKFIDDNKALMKRMYGEFQMSTEYGPPAREIYESKRRHVKREAGEESHKEGPDPATDPDTKSDSYFAKHRQSRQSFSNNQNSQHSESGRVDACESKVEIVTPYWASNSAGKVRAIVNTQHFEQAIHQEVCSKTQTKRCVNDCGCEQKYKWHRLLAYDPDNDCKGIFMDWFLFPSCCVCRCAPTFGNNN